MTFSITTLNHYSECHYAECRILLFVMLSAIMLSVTMLSVVMLGVAAPNAIHNRTTKYKFLHKHNAKVD